LLKDTKSVYCQKKGQRGETKVQTEEHRKVVQQKYKRHIMKPDTKETEDARDTKTVSTPNYERRAPKNLHKVLLAYVLVSKRIKDTLYKRHIDERVISLQTLLATCDMHASDPERLVAEMSSIHEGLLVLDTLLKSVCVQGDVSREMYTLIHLATRASLQTLVDLVASGDVLSSLQHVLNEEVEDMPALTAQRSAPWPRPEHDDSARAHVPLTVRRSSATVVSRTPQRRAAVRSGTSASGLKDDRTAAVLGFIVSHGKVGVPDVAAHFPSVSSKTIQRELAALVTSQKVVKDGARRWTTYTAAQGATAEE
jgi:hypothetical protein